MPPRARIERRGLALNRQRAEPVFWLMTAIIVVLVWALAYYARDEWNLARERDDDEIQAPSARLEEGVRAGLNISEAAQKTSGIDTTPLTAVSWQAETRLYGSVVEIGPLIELRSRYLAAKAEALVARSALDVSAAEYRRIAALYADDRNASQRALQGAQGALKADQARLGAAETAVDGVFATMRGQWGEVLAGWATAADSHAEARQFTSLLNRDQAIVQIAIPFEIPVPAADAKLTLAPLAAADGERPAQLVSPASSVDSAVPGRTFFYRTDARDLRYGARIVARLDAAGESTKGVLVPFPAVIWHGGKSWVYVQTQPGKFERREVQTRREMDKGWFSDELSAGDAVVISGAQLLLSEELKYQIRNENQD